MGLFGSFSLYTPKYKVVGDEVAVFDTSKGTIRVKLDGEGAPIHVANFCELAEKGFYDGLTFHRYVPGFVIQGGDPAGDGTGGPGYCIHEEFTTNPRNSHVDGALAMARASNPNSAGSQFYFCLGPQHALDSGYTVFGTTIEGMDTIAALRKGDIINSITIEHTA
ncbi:MAG: peptidylprolyl isomerase [Tractidigestivibacter sp.]|jgi:peptidyl-prolyl cis-trans isomerase B (cyclophilin B)|uniref:peptidylprolyl isomerase n=1 Tax=Tractidigestivibacter sp. TaxID=2847320 RepID=UPI003D8C2B35